MEYRYRTPFEADAFAENYVEQLPQIYKVALGDTDQHCSICHEEFESQSSDSRPEHAVKLQCSHIFGSECIKTWVRSHNSCPVCRQSIDERLSDSSDEEDEEDEDAVDDLEFWRERSHDIDLAVKLHDYLQRLLYRATATMASSNPEAFSREANALPIEPWVTQGHELARATVTREHLLYQGLQENGHHLPPLRDPVRHEASHLDALFRTLEFMGVFNRHWSGFTPLDDHQEMFLILRQAGFVWDMDYSVDGTEERGAWVGECMSVAGTVRVAVS